VFNPILAFVIQKKQAVNWEFGMYFLINRRRKDTVLVSRWSTNCLWHNVEAHLLKILLVVA
jgi:hypothetical protein